MVMKTMRAGEFKARCLKVMDQVRATREPVIITKRGRQVAKLVPVDTRGDDIFGCLKGVMEIVGDIESPVVAPEEWEANR
jgi:prevent-host-death family protein